MRQVPMCTLERLHVLLGFGAQQNALLANTPRAMLVGKCSRWKAPPNSVDLSKARVLRPTLTGVGSHRL